MTIEQAKELKQGQKVFVVDYDTWNDKSKPRGFLSIKVGRFDKMYTRKTMGVRYRVYLYPLFVDVFLTEEEAIRHILESHCAPLVKVIEKNTKIINFWKNKLEALNEK